MVGVTAFEVVVEIVDLMLEELADVVEVLVAVEAMLEEVSIEVLVVVTVVVVSGPFNKK